MWGELVQEPVEFIDGGNDTVVAVIGIRGHGKSSEAPILSQAIFVHTLRAGKLASMRVFTTKAQPSKPPAVGVGDVGGERGDGTPGPWRLQQARQGDVAARSRP